MIIKSLRVSGYRCLSDLYIEFEPDLTIIVGENDSGKTTLIDALKVITQGKSVVAEDFANNFDEITIECEIDQGLYVKRFHKESGRTNALPIEVRPSADFLTGVQSDLSVPAFEPELPENERRIRSWASFLGVPTRANSNLRNLVQAILTKIESLLNTPGQVIEGANFPEVNSVQLDGRHFENVSSFFKEVFLKEKQASIWKEETESGLSIEQLVRTRIDEYSEAISREIASTGIKDKIKVFIRNLTDIKVEPIYQSRDLNIDAKVMFLVNGQEISVDKKGDGTKRRITMALLDFKKDQEGVEYQQNRIYMLDEPDTHLHVRAQLDLLETLYAFSSKNNQVILTTHSPFVMNAVRPHQVRVLDLGIDGATSCKTLATEAEISSSIFRDLGIDNVYLFFARLIVLVEGRTEEMFVAHHFLKRTGKTINTNFIKVINVEGIQNIPGFARAILELHDNKRLYVLYDNDASDELKNLVERLDIPDEHKFVVGKREFEDAFSDNALFLSWKKHYDEIGATLPKKWTVQEISATRTECDTDPLKKFSTELRKLNQGGKKMTKPILGQALGKHLEESDLPEALERFFKSIEPGS